MKEVERLEALVEAMIEHVDGRVKSHARKLNRARNPTDWTTNETRRVEAETIANALRELALASIVRPQCNVISDRYRTNCDECGE